MADFYTDHDVVTTQQLGRARARDAEQLLIAAQQRRTFITHNGDDFVLLHEAWRIWSRSWRLAPLPLHAGILIIPQSPHLGHEQAAREVDKLVRAGSPLANELFTWRHARGWSRAQ